MTKRDPQCEERVIVKGRGTHQCPFAGIHEYRSPTGEKLRLCGVHRLMRIRRDEHA